MSAQINRVNLWVNGVNFNEIDLRLPPKKTKIAKAKKILGSALGVHHPAFDLLFSCSAIIEGSRGTLTYSDIKAIAEYMNQLENITICNLADCQVDDRGIAALVENLNVHPTLGHLDLRHNKITQVGAQLLSKMLPVCPRKLDLVLSENPLGNEGVIYVAQALKNSSLRTLCLTNTQMGDQGIIALSNMLQVNQTLIGLHVEKNAQITIDGLHAFLLALEHNTHIQNVSMDFPADHPEFKVRLDAILQRNRKIQQDKYNATLAEYRSFRERLRSILQENASQDMEVKSNAELKQELDQVGWGENLDAAYDSILRACQDLQSIGFYDLTSSNDPSPLEMAEELPITYYGSVNNKQPLSQKIKALEAFILTRPAKVPKSLDEKAITSLVLLAIFHFAQAKEWIQAGSIDAAEIDKHLISAYVAGSLVLLNKLEFQLPSAHDIQGLTRQALMLWMDKQNTALDKKSIWDLLEILQKDQGKKDSDQLEVLVLNECERLRLNPLAFKLDKQTCTLLKRYPRLQQFYDEDTAEIFQMSEPVQEDEELKAMWEGINLLRSCRVLALKQCKIDDNRILIFVDALRRNDCLVSLNLGNWLCLTPELESQRQTNPEFQNLNTITEVGVKAILEAIRNKKQFLGLSFELNQMGDKAAIVVAGDLIGNQCLLALNLAVNKLGDVGICALANALKQNHRLVALDVGGNAFSDEGLRAITAMLSMNTSLTSLILEGPFQGQTLSLDCSTQAIEELITQVEQHNFTLTTLGLTFFSLRNRASVENGGVENGVAGKNDEESNKIAEEFDRRIKVVLARNTKLLVMKKAILDQIENLKPRIESRNRPPVEKEKNSVNGVETKHVKEFEFKLKKEYEAILAQCEDLRSRGYPQNKIRELVIAADLAYYSNEQNGLPYSQRIEKLEALAKEARLKQLDIFPEILSKLGHLYWLKSLAYLEKRHDQMQHAEWAILADHLMTAFVCGSAFVEFQSHFNNDYAGLALDILMHNDMTGQSFVNLLQTVQSKIDAHQDLREAYFEKCSFLNIEPHFFVQAQQGIITSAGRDSVCEKKVKSDGQKKPEVVGKGLDDDEAPDCLSSAQPLLFSPDALSSNGAVGGWVQNGLEPNGVLPEAPAANGSSAGLGLPNHIRKKSE